MSERAPTDNAHGCDDGFVSETKYFDKAGKLVAVRTESDVPKMNRACPAWTHYAVITCRVTNVKQLCKACRTRGS